SKLDWEVELAIVIGRRARYLSKDKALDVVAGYCLANDVSERVFQLERTGQWTKGKSAESFGPLGPWLVTKDEIKDPQRLNMWLDVNGDKRQRGNTRTMIFDCKHLVWYCSQFFVLEPGDIITTGTPPGVGLGMKPEPKFLKAGDVVTLGIDGLGEQRQKVVKAKAELRSRDEHTEIRDPACRHSASLRAFTPVFDGLWTRVNALMAHAGYSLPAPPSLFFSCCLQVSITREVPVVGLQVSNNMPLN